MDSAAPLQVRNAIVFFVAVNMVDGRHNRGVIVLNEFDLVE